MKRDHWTPEKLAELEKRMDETPLVCGIDEVGRGPLAGPVVACAIIMPHGKRIDGVRDSKKLSERKREALYEQILSSCIAWGMGISDERMIDQINIRQATLVAMRDAVRCLRNRGGVRVQPDLLVIDAETIDTDLPQVSVIHGDDRIYAISCASIVAKVARDRLMVAYDGIFPHYGFAQHKGYGTRKHLEAIRTYGQLPIHRASFLHERNAPNGSEPIPPADPPEPIHPSPNDRTEG